MLTALITEAIVVQFNDSHQLWRGQPDTTDLDILSDPDGTLTIWLINGFTVACVDRGKVLRCYPEHMPQWGPRK